MPSRSSGGRPTRHEAAHRRHRLLGVCAEGAPSFADAIRAADVSPAHLVTLLDELGLKPQLVAMLSDDPDLRATAAALRSAA